MSPPPRIGLRRIIGGLRGVGGIEIDVGLSVD